MHAHLGARFPARPQPAGERDDTASEGGRIWLHSSSDAGGVIPAAS